MRYKEELGVPSEKVVESSHQRQADTRNSWIKMSLRGYIQVHKTRPWEVRNYSTTVKRPTLRSEHNRTRFRHYHISFLRMRKKVPHDVIPLLFMLQHDSVLGPFCFPSSQSHRECSSVSDLLRGFKFTLQRGRMNSSRTRLRDD